jgi:hypothetical protein
MGLTISSRSKFLLQLPNITHDETATWGLPLRLASLVLTPAHHLELGYHGGRSNEVSSHEAFHDFHTEVR